MAPADGTGIGGGFADWYQTRTPALQIDTPNPASAYKGIRWTRWGGRNIAAIDAYEGGSTTSAPTIVMYLDAQSNAWTFGHCDISRGAGGTVYGRWNLSPFTTAGGSVNGNVYASGRVQGADVMSLGYVYAGGGGGQLANDGNTYGSIWGGWLSNWLNVNCTGRTPIQSGGNYGYVRNTSGNVVTLACGTAGLIDMTVDSSYIGGIITHSNYQNWGIASRGANCQWNSGATELGPISNGTVDAPQPQVMVGMRSCGGSSTANCIWIRTAYNRNN